MRKFLYHMFPDLLEFYISLPLVTFSIQFMTRDEINHIYLYFSIKFNVYKWGFRFTAGDSREAVAAAEQVAVQMKGAPVILIPNPSGKNFVGRGGRA